MKFTIQIATFVGVCAFAPNLHAQSVVSQEASISGFGNAVNLGYLPVINSSGVTVYKDVTITLKADGAGNLTYATAKPSAVRSHMVSPVSLRPGIYTEIGSNPKAEIQLNGPQPLVSGGGVDVWTITVPSSALKGGTPSPAVFYTGPAASYPAALYKQIQQDQIKTKTYIGFGFVQSGNTCTNSPCWSATSLFGIYTVGTQVMFDQFNGGPSPIQEVTYSPN